MAKDYSLLSFMLRGKRRRKVLGALKDKVKMPKQIADECELSISNVSASIKELLTNGLVECMNPKEHIFKFYGITAKGKKALGLVD